jgi:hypothetical protein
LGGLDLSRLRAWFVARRFRCFDCHSKLAAFLVYAPELGASGICFAKLPTALKTREIGRHGNSE